MINNEQLDSGPQPPDQDDKQISLTTGVIYDGHPINSDYGYVKLQTLSSYNIGEIVHCSFVAGNPRNNPMQEYSYFYVDQKQDNGDWKVIATDANWETKYDFQFIFNIIDIIDLSSKICFRFVWERVSTIFGLSDIEFFWEIPSYTQPGTYRVRHTGYYRYIFGGVYPYEGGSRTFVVL